MAGAREWELPTHGDMFALAVKAFVEGTDAHGQLVPGELKALCADLRAWYRGEPTASLAAVAARIVHLVHVHEILPAACRTQFLLQLLRDVCADNEHTIAATDHQLEIVGNVAFAHPSSAQILAAQLENVIVAQADSGTLAPMPGTVELPLAAILGAGPEQVPDRQWDHYCQDALLPAAGVTQTAGWVPWAPVIYDPDYVGTDAYQRELAVKLREVGVVIVVLHPGVFELAWVIGALGPHIPLLVLDNAANERPPQIPDDCYRQWVDAAGVRAHVEEFLARAADHLATQQPDPTLVAAWRVSGIAVRRARLLRRWTPPAGISDPRLEELLSGPAAFARARAWELDALTTSLGITPIRWGGMWAPDAAAATASTDTPPATAIAEEVEMPCVDAIDGADHPVPARPAPALLEEPDSEPDSEPERPRKGQLAGQMALELDGVEPDERGWALKDQSLGAMEVVLAGTGWETTEWLTSEERSAFAQASGSWPEAHRTWMYRWAQARRALEYVMRDERRRVPVRMRLVRLTSPLDWTEQLRVQKSRRFR